MSLYLHRNDYAESLTRRYITNRVTGEVQFTIEAKSFFAGFLGRKEYDRYTKESWSATHATWYKGRRHKSTRWGKVCNQLNAGKNGDTFGLSKYRLGKWFYLFNCTLWAVELRNSKGTTIFIIVDEGSSWIVFCISWWTARSFSKMAAASCKELVPVAPKQATLSCPFSGAAFISSPSGRLEILICFHPVY